jgi:hypothetical protein
MIGRGEQKSKIIEKKEEFTGRSKFEKIARVLQTLKKYVI